MIKKNNKSIKSTILFLTIIFCFFVFASAVSTVSAVDLSTNDTEIVTSTEDVNIIDQDLSNSNATINNKELNIRNSNLNNFKLSNNNGNVAIFDSIIKNSNLNFNNNDEIIIKNTKFYNTNIQIDGATTLYLINCTFYQSNINSNVTNLLTLDLIINKTSKVNFTTEHIWGNGIVFVNDHSNLYLNVTETRGGNWGNTNDYTHDYAVLFPKANELAGFNAYSNQIIMVNGSSNATGYINGTLNYGYYDFLTFSSQDSIDTIIGAVEFTDHNSNSGDIINLWAQYGSTLFKLPNGTIVELIHGLSFHGYSPSNYNTYRFSFYGFVDNSIYTHYQTNYESYYFESVNCTYDYWTGEGNLGQMLLFSMLLAYNDTGFTNSDGPLVRDDGGHNYYIFFRNVETYTNILKIYINDVYNRTYEMVDYYNSTYWYSMYDYTSGNSIYSLNDLINAYSGDYERNYTDYQNVFLYKNIKYVDENGTVLGTEDLNMIFSLLSMEIGVPYSAIKYHYETYGFDGILMLLNINMDDSDEVDQVRSDVEDYMNELNQIIDEIVIGQIGIDIWKTVVVSSNSTISNETECNCGSCGNNGTDPNGNQGNGNNQTPGNNGTDPNGNQGNGNNQTPGNNGTDPNGNQGSNDPKGGKTPAEKTTKKRDLAILKVKKLKASKNKQVISYKITIKNKGNLKSRKTTLDLWHIRHNVKTKVKIVNIKALKPGQKIKFVISYYPDRDCHKYCKKQYFVLNPLKNIKESTYKNNKKILKA